jgi:hypothetical protein
MGVGRGADLLLYLAIVLGGFLFLLVYSKIKRIERDITEVVRQMAILQSQLIEKSNNTHA